MATNQELTVKERLGTLKDLLTAFKPQLGQVAAKHLTPERLVALTLSAASRNPKLALCTGQSILKGVMDAAQLGLEIGGPLAGGWLVPYNNKRTGKPEAQFIPGYQGLIDLARRSGGIDSIAAYVVRDADKFSYRITEMGPELRHEPDLEGESKLKFVYAIARIKGASIPQIELMTLAQIQGIRKRSRSGEDSPWVTDFEEMARKTVVRRLVKYLPKSAELAQAVAIEDRAEGNEVEVELQDLSELPEPVLSTTASVKESLRGPEEREPGEEG